LFFFQAEDGIRDFHVTGVQTCALPIYSWLIWGRPEAASLLLRNATYSRNSSTPDSALSPRWPATRWACPYACSANSSRSALTSGSSRLYHRDASAWIRAE